MDSTMVLAVGDLVYFNDSGEELEAIVRRIQGTYLELEVRDTNTQRFKGFNRYRLDELRISKIITAKKEISDAIGSKNCRKINGGQVESEGQEAHSLVKTNAPFVYDFNSESESESENQNDDNNNNDNNENGNENESHNGPIKGVIQDKSRQIVVPDQVDIDYEPYDFDFWVDIDQLNVPCSNSVIKTLSLTPQDIEDILGQSAIGLAFFPSDADRRFPLDFIAMACEKNNYLLKVNSESIQCIKAIAEESHITKIVHGAISPSDCLFNRYGIHLRAVWDTQVADFKLCQKNFRKKKLFLRSWEHCMEDYFFKELPWNDDRDFYSRSGKGLLLRTPLDQSGQSYVRAMVCYLQQMQFEQVNASLRPWYQHMDAYINSKKNSETRAHQYICLNQDQWAELCLNKEPDRDEELGEEFFILNKLRVGTQYNRKQRLSVQRMDVSTQTKSKNHESLRNENGISVSRYFSEQKVRRANLKKIKEKFTSPNHLIASEPHTSNDQATPCEPEKELHREYEDSKTEIVENGGLEVEVKCFKPMFPWLVGEKRRNSSQSNSMQAHNILSDSEDDQDNLYRLQSLDTCQNPKWPKEKNPRHDASLFRYCPAGHNP